MYSSCDWPVASAWHMFFFLSTRWQPTSPTQTCSLCTWSWCYAQPSTSSYLYDFTQEIYCKFYTCSSIGKVVFLSLASFEILSSVFYSLNDMSMCTFFLVFFLLCILNFLDQVAKFWRILSHYYIKYVFCFICLRWYPKSALLYIWNYPTDLGCFVVDFLFILAFVYFFAFQIEEFLLTCLHAHGFIHQLCQINDVPIKSILHFYYDVSYF